MIEARRDEAVKLKGDKRKGQKHGGKHGELNLREKKLMRRGINKLQLPRRPGRLLKRPQQKIENIAGKADADTKSDGKLADAP